MKYLDLLGATSLAISFQSQDVVDILLRDEVYYANPNLYREGRDYKLDREQLDGKQPVWLFQSDDRIVDADSFVDGTLFELMRCEMSVSPKRLHEMVMLELRIPAGMAKTGLTHNASDYAKVVPYLKREWLMATYRVSRLHRWYYSTVTVLQAFSPSMLFPNGLQCHGEEDAPYDTAD